MLSSTAVGFKGNDFKILSNYFKCWGGVDCGVYFLWASVGVFLNFSALGVFEDFIDFFAF